MVLKLAQKNCEQIKVQPHPTQHNNKGFHKALITQKVWNIWPLQKEILKEFERIFQCDLQQDFWTDAGNQPKSVKRLINIIK